MAQLSVHKLVNYLVLLRVSEREYASGHQMVDVMVPPSDSMMVRMKVQMLVVLMDLQRV